MTTYREKPYGENACNVFENMVNFMERVSKIHRNFTGPTGSYFKMLCKH